MFFTVSWGSWRFHAHIEVQEVARKHACFLVSILTQAAGVHVKHTSNVILLSERVMYLDVRVGSRKLQLVAAYAPHAGYSEDDFKTFPEQFHTSVTGACMGGRQTFCGGDFNLQLDVGSRVVINSLLCRMVSGCPLRMENGE